MMRAAVCAALILTATRAAAQSALPDGVFPQAHFQITYEKYVDRPEEYAPLYSWDAWMQLDATVWRRHANAVAVTADIQTVGTENLHSKVSVGAAGYVLGFGYTRAMRALDLSAGFQHVSSHLTRDLDDKESDVRSYGGTIPHVVDPAEFNIVYIKGAGTLTRLPFAPHVVALVAPVAFRFNASPAGNVRRVYVSTEWTMWKGLGDALVVETQHELGPNLLDVYTVRFDLLRRDDTATFQIFLAAAPGHELHVSPIAGAVLDGLSVGARLAFHSTR